MRIPPIIRLTKWNAVNTLTTCVLTGLLGSSVFFSVEAQGQTTIVGKAKLAAIFEQLRLSLDRIKSIQYRGELTVEDVTVKGPRREQYQYEYALEGNLFYSSFRVVESGKTATVANNGEKFQKQNEHGSLKYSKKGPWSTDVSYSGVIQPLVAPFLLFAFDNPTFLEFEILLKQSTWEKILSNATLKGEDEHEGRNCEVVALKNGPGMLLVYFDKASDYYPVKILSKFEKVEEKVEVDTLKIETARGNVFVPIKCRQETIEEKKTPLIQTYAIDPGSIKVNVPIDHNLFTLDESQAKDIYNKDEKRFDKPPVRRKRPENLESNQWYFVVGALVIVALFVVYKRRGFKKKRIV